MKGNTDGSPADRHEQPGTTGSPGNIPGTAPKSEPQAEAAPGPVPVGGGVQSNPDEAPRVRFGTVTPLKRGRGRPKGSRNRRTEDDEKNETPKAAATEPAAGPSPNAVVYADTLVKAIAAMAERYKMPLLEEEKKLLTFAYARLIEKYNLTFSVEFEAAFLTGCVLVPRVLAARKLAERGLLGDGHA